MDAICDDLEAEHAALDAVLERLDERGWDTATPAAGWTVRDQVSHLWFFDQKALLALTDADAFVEDARQLMAGGVSTDSSIEPGRSTTAAAMVERWHADRAALIATARGVDPSSRIPWYGPAMGARSFLTARLMETWAHGQDVVDALDADRPATDRLRHVAHIGVKARPFSYVNRGMTMPDEEILVALEPPGDGDRWTWGDPNAASSVRGPALDFCLVVTQRRHVDDTVLEVRGDAAREWMTIAQAFAGPPGEGRPPRGR